MKSERAAQGLKILLPIVMFISVIFIALGSYNTTLAYLISKTNTITNTFIPRPNAIFVEVKAEKVIEFEGDEIPSLAGFDFLVIDHDRNDRYLKTTDESGIVSFMIEFNEEDAGNSYHFTIEEVQGENEDIVYSDKVYEFDIEVTLGTDNKLYAVLTYEGDEVSDFSVQFVNILKGDSNLPPTGVDNIGIIIGVSLLGVCILIMVLLVLLKRKDKKD